MIKKAFHLVVFCTLLFLTNLAYSQTNPTAQSLPYSQDFGTTTFSVLPTGTAAWTVNSSPLGTQSSAESSTTNGDGGITATSTVQTTGGVYGYATSSNGRLYIQTSSNATNGTTQFALAINTTSKSNIKISYDIEMLSATPRTVGKELQYRVGTSGSWTTISGTTYSHNSTDRNTGDIDHFTSITLPSGAENQSVVQLRWITWRGSETGNSSGLGIDNISITSGPSLTVNSPTICAGNSATLTVSGATTYSWSPATGLNTTTGATVIATPTASTTYTVTGTASSGTATVISSITVNALPTLTITPNTAALCAGTSTTITATGASSYAWSPTAGLNSSTSASVVATPTASTTYTITGTNSNGCVNTNTAAVTVNPVNSITVTPGSATICIGSSTNLVASGASSYNWSPSGSLNTSTSASVTATPTANTTYTVTGNCNQTKTVTITVNALPSLTITPSSTTICSGNSTTLTATGASTYSWSPSVSLSSATGASVTATPTASTTYTLTATNSNSCVNTKTVALTVNALPTLTITPNTATVCAGSSTTLTASGASTYTWSPTAGLNTSTSATVIATPTANTTYTITGTNSNGCVNTNTAAVTVKPINTITVTPSSATICVGSNTNLVASGANSYNWSPSASLNTNTGANVTATPTANTTYTVTGDCNQTTTVAVIVNALPSLTITPSTATICAGSPTTLTATGASTYSWSPAASLSLATGASVTATPTANTAYTLTATNANNCVNTKTATVTVNALPSLTITPNNPSICAGASTTLTASGASTYSWSPATGLNTTTGASVTATPTATTNYTITATNSNGCVGTQTAAVNINLVPSLTVTPNNPTICNATSATLTASGASTYSWSPSAGLNTTSGATVISNPSSGTVYTVSGTGSDGCLATATATVSLSQVNAGTALATGGTNLCSNSQVALSLSNANVNQVGTGTNSSEKYPFDGYYNYSWSDVIYLQSDLGSAGTLTSLSFYVNNGPSNFVMNSQNIYIRTTTASSFTNSTYPTTSGFTQVFSGTITYNGTGWKTITLNTPFTYDGTSNLEILYENHDGSWGNGFPTFNYTSGYSANRLKRDYEDAAFPTSCSTCGAYAYVPNTQFTFTRTLDNFVKWQSSTDNINYVDITGGTTQNFTTTANTSKYFRAQVSNGTCTAPSATAYYITNNNYYVNDNSTTGDVFTTVAGSSTNDGKSHTRPNTSINYILTTYTLSACDTIFVDNGTYSEEVDIYYPQGGNSSGYATIHGAGIGKTILNAPSGSNNVYMYQPDYWKIEGFTMNSTQTHANVLVYEASHNILSKNKFTQSAYSNVQVFGDNLNANRNQFLYNNFTNSSTTGNALEVEGNADSTFVQGDTITMSNASSQDAVIFSTYNDGSNVFYPSQTNVTQNVISAYSYGISLYGYDYPISTFTLSNNNITLNTKTISDGAPIWLSSVGSSSSDQTIIYNNRLIGGNNGIYFGSSANYEKIYNNYISGNNYGIYVNSSTSNSAQLYFNSFYNSITNLYFVSSANAFWKVKDNILYTTSTTTTNANIVVGNATTFSDCNYNLYYAPSGASTARFNATNYTSLSNWQAITHSSATTHGDENSVSGNPLYSNTASNNLDVIGLTPTDEKGIAITGITTDIYNHPRSTPPSIGAEEPIPVANAGSNVSICFGGSVQLSGGTGLNYSWAPAAGLSSTTIANPIASPTLTTQYTLTVSDGSESSTSNVIVTVNSLPIVSVASTSSISICPGNTLTLGGSPTATTGNAPYTYSWSPLNGLSSTSISNPIASPTTSTTYSLLVRDNNSCVATGSVTVLVLSNNISVQLPEDLDSTIMANGDTLSYIISSQGISYTVSPAATASFCVVPPTTNTTLVPVTVTFYTKNSKDTLVTFFTIDSLSTMSAISIISRNPSTRRTDTTALDSSYTSNYRTSGNSSVFNLSSSILGLVFPVAIVYATLQRSLDASYYIATNGGLNFKYEEEYADKDQVLTYTIYDAYHNTLVSTKNNTAKLYPVKEGDNRYSMNLDGCSFTPSGPLGSGMYLLEVENEKKEKWYLRVQNNVTRFINCPHLINGGGASSH